MTSRRRGAGNRRSTARANAGAEVSGFKMVHPISEVRMITLTHDFAENGDLVVMEGLADVPFAIARVFVVRASSGAVRGQHAHLACTQFLTCPAGRIEVLCDDGLEAATFTLDRPEAGLLIPPTIWAQQTYLAVNSVLTVLCDRPYEREDYIWDYDAFKALRREGSKGRRSV